MKLRIFFFLINASLAIGIAVVSVLYWRDHQKFSLMMSQAKPSFLMMPYDEKQITDRLEFRGFDRSEIELYRSLIRQEEAWRSGLIQSLCVDEIHTCSKWQIPRITWQSQAHDADDKLFNLYILKRMPKAGLTLEDFAEQLLPEIYIVTDTDNSLSHWEFVDVPHYYVKDGPPADGNGRFPVVVKWKGNFVGINYRPPPPAGEFSPSYGPNGLPLHDNDSTYVMEKNRIRKTCQDFR